MTDPLFEAVDLGALALRNAVVMAPMTRDRAGPGDVPTDLMVDYYRQRASAGLIVTEGTQPSADGKGYWRTPGIWSPDQVAGWSRIAEAVHERGGLIVVQLMHCGRVCVIANKQDASQVVAPSAIPSADKVPGPDGVPVPTAQPRALATQEVREVVQQYADAARNARKAGLDGVELHCASGYLANQFLNPNSNDRTDEYGGSVENRIRFVIEVLQAMGDAIGHDRVGFRISPGNPYNDMVDPDPAATFVPLLQAADKLGLAYVHLVDVGGMLQMVQDNWSGSIIANNGLKPDGARELLSSGRAQAVSFGRHFISNPDLVERLRENAELTRVDRDRIYTGEEQGYTDYPERDGVIRNTAAAA
ncbi:alkene reductase [Croceicoccus sp. F390]|uniref:Alkene reductase n=1 Tax=Croceicoccus esteveae TaxID=3075597 RepID=A0ABU2ZF67_9SPHN|nr:alkene reductase [Croceicoccus sp. F390]MDT0574996.1 alkene reductase [Croceicoccus sp. F390]